MGGFAIYPAPGGGRGNDDAARGNSSSSRHSSTTAAAASTRSSSSVSSLHSADDGHQHQNPHTLLEMPPSASRKHHHHRSTARLFQKLRNVLPLLTPRCGRMQVGFSSSSGEAVASSSGAVTMIPLRRPCRRVTGTLYGHRKGRVALALQETPRCVPGLVVELALQTHALLRELGNPAGARIVLETERRRRNDDDDEEEDGGSKAIATAGGGRRRRGGGRRHGGPPLMDEPRWTMFCNGRKTGLAVRREATADDLAVLETLRAVSMGAGVLPGTRSSGDTAQGTVDDEVPYMRGSFDHFVGSRDSESLYMIAPQGGGSGPELAVFFVRL
ncbi:hypothetical protein PR202_ga30604 [Eleusine coracana subsp. coracana]|uniref:Protein MIZU-KUSSEI 1 n=1 Tax=Eleusine coracana subsp. coracana TaxID=191504 RepID=A0AAV5DPR0_ELECO|nr:hypothetical protein QOZ80_8AG0618950 [Eleusine coracana subsp. coracana]GJN12334.1 hypothetical protein PR202_ga30604 [Eleusine coracana subsp. coracana]